MLARLLKLLSLVLVGFVVFLFGAMAYAKLFGRESVQQEPDADEVDLVVTFGPLEYKGTSQTFRGGAVTTWFGGGGIDLGEAALAPGGATLRIQALFGGGTLVVPEGWRVESRVIGIGGVGDSRPRGNPSAGAPTLRLEGYAIFGGWGIMPAVAVEAIAVDDTAGA